MAMNTEVEKLERRWQENPLGLTFAPLAEAYRKSGDTARALDLLSVGLAQHPHYVPAHIVRGRCHLDGQDSAGAESAFRRVTELDPENVIALKSLADLAEKEGRLTEAMGRLELLLEVDRNNEDARGQLDRLRELLAAPALVDPDLLRPYENTEITPAPTGEFQLADDPVALHPSDDRFPEIVLQSEVEGLALPVPEAAQGSDMIAEPDPLAAMGTRSVELDEPEPAQEAPAAEAEVSGIEARFEREPADLRAEFAEPVLTEWEGSDPLAELEPEAAAPLAEAAAESFGWEQLQQPEPVFETDPELEPETAAASLESELVVTETMAEIFLRQGHRELALAVYSQLAQRDPENDRIAGAYARLQAELLPRPPEPETVEPTPAPKRYEATATGGRSVADVFTALLSIQRPTVAAAIHPPAFETARRPIGEPTRPAPDSLSLSAVFGDEGVPPGPAAGRAEPSAAEPNFEQFFAPVGEGAPEMELPKSPDGEAPAMSSSAPEDLEQFNTWLRGLKR